MKWPFDPRLLEEVEAVFVLVMLLYAISSIWLAWTLLVIGLMRDLFGR